MQIIDPAFEIMDANAVMRNIELGGRCCYKSEDKIAPGSDAALVEKLKTLKHESVLEHGVITVWFRTDRGVTHELVRHRLASFSQESTRYVSSVSAQREVVESEQEVIDLYAQGMSMRRVAEMSDGKYTEWDVYKILDANGVERRPLGNTGIVHDDFFDSIDTVEKAYLLGMIQADGSVRSATGSPQVSITQHEDYAWYLHRMVSEFIRPNAKASKDKKCRQISFLSPRLRDALIGMGVVPNKSHDQTDADVEKLWAAIPATLIPAFLRGFMDGDGGVRFYKQKNAGQTDSCNVNWSGHKHLLEKIAAWLEETFGYKASVRPAADTKHLHRIAVTNPMVGDDLVRLMLIGFKFPYGHPAKTARMIERVGGGYPVASFGDPKFFVIMPDWVESDAAKKFLWLRAMDSSERAYSALRLMGCSAQEARSVLPNSLKTEIQVTANVREWRKILELRTHRDAHPQMRQIMVPLGKVLAARWPSLFGEYANTEHPHPATEIVG